MPSETSFGRSIKHRAWPAAAGDVERLVDGARQIGGALHKIVVLGARPGDAGGVALLKGVVADQVGRHLAAEDHQRHAVHQRIGDAGDGVGGAGPGGHDHYSHLAGRSRVAFGSVHGAAFLADQDVANAVLLKKFVIYGENGASGVSEYIRDALIHERLDEDLRTGHLFVRHYKLLLGWRLALEIGRHVGAKKSPAIGRAGQRAGNLAVQAVPVNSRWRINDNVLRRKLSEYCSIRHKFRGELVPQPRKLPLREAAG